MKILITGRGGAGSWSVRGEQIGEALGATVKANATVDVMRAHDVILVVKRVPFGLVHALREAGRPWVYDIVDAYPQPDCTRWPRAEAVRWVRERVAMLSPAAVIWPNARMRDDCGEGPVIYHHHRPGLAVNPIRPQVRRVGYDGSLGYLNGWISAIDDECARRGWEFVPGCVDLASVDIVLALRGEATNGYAQRHWKSNVKLANAHASGTPFVGAPECGYLETASGAEHFAQTPRELAAAFDWLEDQATRQAVRDAFLPHTRALAGVAEQVRAVCAANC